MDIKNALNAILPPSLRKVAPSERQIKAGDTTDRDANGQAAYDQNQKQQHHEPMTEEQLKKALEHLASLPAVKDHNLSVELVDLQGKKFVLLKEANGKVLRKIPESELWTLPVMNDSDPRKKGQLLRKTA
ncbi:MAG: flagellar protein FlaG [Pseudobdellovibrionaceae bacterium]